MCSQVGEIIQYWNKFYKCEYSDYIYFYANNKVFKCSKQLVVVEIADQQIIRIPAVKTCDNGKFSIDEIAQPDFFVTNLYEGNNKYYSTIFDSIVEFDRLNIRILGIIPDFLDDRPINKLAIVRRRMFFTNAVDLYEMIINTDQNDPFTFVPRKLMSFDSKNLRIYNIMNQLVIRNCTREDVFHVLGIGNSLSTYKPTLELNLFVYTFYGIFMFAKRQVGYSTHLLTFNNSKLTLLEQHIGENHEKIIGNATKWNEILWADGFNEFQSIIERSYEQFKLEEQKLQQCEDFVKQTIKKLVYDDNNMYYSESPDFLSFLTGGPQFLGIMQNWMLEFALNQKNATVVENLIIHCKQGEIVDYSNIVPLIKVGIPVLTIKMLKFGICPPLKKQNNEIQILLDIYTRNPSIWNKLIDLLPVPFQLFQQDMFQKTFVLTQLSIIEKQPASTIEKIFIEAAKCGCLRIVQQLKDRYSNQQIIGNRALQQAIEKSEQAIVLELMQFELQDNRNTELMLCIALNNHVMLDLFIHQIGIRRMGRSAIHDAAIQGCEYCVKKLTQENNIRDEDGRTALMLAMEHKHFNLFSCLTAELGSIDKRGNCALLIAISSGAPIQVLQILFQKEQIIIQSMPIRMWHIQLPITYQTKHLLTGYSIREKGFPQLTYSNYFSKAFYLSNLERTRILDEIIYRWVGLVDDTYDSLQ